jgi:antitoxin VapB
LQQFRTAQTTNLQTKHSIPGSIVAGPDGWKTFRSYGTINVMALNIKDEETEAVVSKIASLTGETHTEAVRRAAKERLERLEVERAVTREAPTQALRRGQSGPRRKLDYDPKESDEAFEYYLETEIWPLMKPENLGKTITKVEREKLLGYGPGGV